MNQLTYFRAQAYNNALANFRLLTSCEQLTTVELSAERSGFFPSIIHTLNHIVTVDWFYVSALEGSCCGPSAWEVEIPFPKLKDLVSEQRLVDRRLILVCDTLEETKLSEHVDLVRETWTQSEPANRVLLHLFQHQIHHRGQVHSMLAATHVAPPQLDEFFLGHEKEIALRALDFAELGFEEEAIWR